MMIHLIFTNWNKLVKYCASLKVEAGPHINTAEIEAGPHINTAEIEASF